MGFVKHNTRALRNPNTCPNCGGNIAYWAHDTESVGSTDASYCSEHNSYSWVYLTADAAGVKAGDRADYRYVHYCPNEGTPRYWDGPAKGKSEESDEPKAEPKPEVKADPNDPMAALKALIMSVVGESADPAETERMIDLKVAAARADMLTKTGDLIKTTLGEIGALPTRVEVKRADGEVYKVEGLAHAVLPDVIKVLNLDENILMVGPAGTGKSHIGRQAAEALNLPFYAMSVGPTMLESKLLGYMDAKGDFISTAFYEWTKKGGVLLLDEVDNGNAGVLNVSNAALSNKFVQFPNGELVDLHETCLCIAAANTYGLGPDRAYVGRQALDAAFRDRFCFIDVPYDLALERALCLATGLPQARVDKVLTYVRKLRANVEEAKLPVVIGQRKAVRLCKLLNGGFKVEKAIVMSLSAGISTVDWQKITSGAPGVYTL